MEYISSLIIPILFVLISVMILFSGNDIFDHFLEGAKNGIATSFKLLPTLIALIVGVSMFSASGAVDILVKIFTPVGSIIGIPAEVLPLVILRPISGSASTAMANDLFLKYSPDSFAGHVISVLMGSSDTIIYVFAVYFSSIGIKKTRYAGICAFLTMIFCLFFSCFISRLFFT